MDMQTALRARLIGSAAVAELVGDRVSWVERPQGEVLPAITLQTISAAREQNYAGFQEMQEARVQLDAWGATYGDARAAAEAAVAAVTAPATESGIKFRRMGFGRERDLGDRSATDQSTTYRISMDLIVRWSAA